MNKSFREISFWQMISDYKIVIPKMQRDYAQGRQDNDIKTIRKDILNVIFQALSSDGKQLGLDFVYGEEKKEKVADGKEINVFYPLDGQQRLTTLFLLHWYIAVKENRNDLETKNLLANFTYETRHSSKVFCQRLVENMGIVLKKPKISESIKDQSWFFAAWEHDPTIESMLVMLDEIQDKADKLEGVWHLLTSNLTKITFNLLPMKDMGLPDELYIKMNSRGKPLTKFEHFKCQFAELLGVDHREKFSKQIDKAGDEGWYDLFWTIAQQSPDRGNDIAKEADDAVLRYFRFIRDILAAKIQIEIDEDTNDIERFEKVFCGVENKNNVDFLFKSLDIFVELQGKRQAFFSSVFYVSDCEYSTIENKNADAVRLFFSNSVADLFRKCAKEYDSEKQRQTRAQNPFSIGEQLLLYVSINHLMKETEDFHSKIRVLRNLIVRLDYFRHRDLSEYLHSVDVLFQSGIEALEKSLETCRSGLTPDHVIKEEVEKFAFLQQNPEYRVDLFRMEDHDHLCGCLAIFECAGQYADAKKYADMFCKIFQKTRDHDKLDRALLTFGDYTQSKERSDTKCFSRNYSHWKIFFAPLKTRTNFNETKRTLRNFFECQQDNLDLIIEGYLEKFKTSEIPVRDWKYYYIKYEAFRNHEKGNYWWSKASQYECIELKLERFSAPHWNPFLLTIHKEYPNSTELREKGEAGNPAPLEYRRGNKILLEVRCKDKGYCITVLNDEGRELLEKAKSKYTAWLINYEDSTWLLKITQTDIGDDTEDRIEKALELLAFFEDQ